MAHQVKGAVKFLGWITVYSFVSFQIFASTKVEDSFLEFVKKDPKKSMSVLPAKMGLRLSPEILQDKELACRMNRSRSFLAQKHMMMALPPTDFGNDDPTQFLEVQSIEKNIYQLDQKYRVASVNEQPWSGDYWALRFGGAAKRYADFNFPGNVREEGKSDDWVSAYKYFQDHSTLEEDLDKISPTEKYDLLVGDLELTLTSVSWMEGQHYQDEKGDVEPWMGLCHGWAPASFMEPRPTQTVQLQSLKGERQLKFRPDDIKALLTLKWAKGIVVTKDYRSLATRFLGGRCDVKDPKSDEETGRIIEPKCYDLNPGAWHIVITNHIGQENRPLIIDASYDLEVWNQPVVEYRYSYFNPKSLKPTGDINKARVSLADENFKDRFAKFRNNEKAKELIGVIMNVTYMAENTPTTGDYDGPQRDRVITAQYYYDLEIDERGEVVGGEWYQNAHPDFIWMPEKESIVAVREDLRVKSRVDAILAAPIASRSGTPLNYILNLLKQK